MPTGQYGVPNTGIVGRKGFKVELGRSTGKNAPTFAAFGRQNWRK